MATTILTEQICGELILPILISMDISYIRVSYHHVSKPACAKQCFPRNLTFSFPETEAKDLCITQTVLEDQTAEEGHVYAGQ